MATTLMPIHTATMPSNRLRTNVGCSHPRLIAAQEKYCFETESREGGESAQQTGEQKEPGFGAKQVVLFHEASKNPNNEATSDVDCERC